MRSAVENEVGKAGIRWNHFNLMCLGGRTEMVTGEGEREEQ